MWGRATLAVWDLVQRGATLTRYPPDECLQDDYLRIEAISCDEHHVLVAYYRWGLTLYDMGRGHRPEEDAQAIEDVEG